MSEVIDKPIVNTILVYEVAGQVFHRFCTEAEGLEALKLAKAHGSGGSMFTSDEMKAELVYAVAPELRSRVEEAKRKLKLEIDVRDTLTRHGVPGDHDLRVKIYAAIKELRETVLRPVS